MNLTLLYQNLLANGKRIIREKRGTFRQCCGQTAVPGGRVDYWMFGSGTKTPLVVVHGGPGFPHNYLLPLKKLAVDRTVVFYDQLDCGTSERPKSSDAWRVTRFVDELLTLCKTLGIAKAHLLGHSWGAVVALECAFGTRLASSLILASPCISIPRWIADSKQLRAELDDESQAALDEADVSGDYDTPPATRAVKEYYRRFVYGVHRFEDLIAQSEAGFGVECYHAMWGPTEFQLTGVLADYDGTEKLRCLKLPVLYTCGRFDEATPETTRWYTERTPGAKLRVFQLSAHMPHLSETDEYVCAVKKFIEDSESETVKNDS